MGVYNFKNCWRKRKNAFKFIKDSAAKQTEYVKTLKMEESAEKMYK
jgi:hypothetical protein